MQRAPGTCSTPGCAGVPVARGRCRQHLVWAPRNPDRADGRTIRRLRDRLAQRDGYRCRHPEASSSACTRGNYPLEVHHLDGDVTNDELENLELRCRRHNPRAAALAPKTRALYTGLYDGHLSPTLGGYPLRELTPEVIGRWQADRLAAGAPVESTRKALTLLGGILQRALEAGRIVQPTAARQKDSATRDRRGAPLSPVTVEAIRATLGPRRALLVALLAYAGVRPQEARALCWGHVQARTLVVHAPKTRRHRTQPRTVRLLEPLRQDLLERRLASGRPGDRAPVLPGLDGGEWGRGRIRAMARQDLGRRPRARRAALSAPL